MLLLLDQAVAPHAIGDLDYPLETLERACPDVAPGLTGLRAGGWKLVRACCSDGGGCDHEDNPLLDTLLVFEKGFDGTDYAEVAADARACGLPPAADPEFCWQDGQRHNGEVAGWRLDGEPDAEYEADPDSVRRRRRLGQCAPAASGNLDEVAWRQNVQRVGPPIACSSGALASWRSAGIPFRPSTVPVASRKMRSIRQQGVDRVLRIVARCCRRRCCAAPRARRQLQQTPRCQRWRPPRFTPR